MGEDIILLENRPCTHGLARPGGSVLAAMTAEHTPDTVSS